MWGQRRYERVAFYTPLQVTVLPEGPTVPANAVDLSAGGVGIVAEVMLDRGQDVRIRFQLSNGSQHVVEEDVLGRVAFCRADENGNCMGIAFLQTIHASAQPALTQKFSRLSSS